MKIMKHHLTLDININNQRVISIINHRFSQPNPPSHQTRRSRLRRRRGWKRARTPRTTSAARRWFSTRFLRRTGCVGRIEMEVIYNIYIIYIICIIYYNIIYIYIFIIYIYNMWSFPEISWVHCLDFLTDIYPFFTGYL